MMSQNIRLGLEEYISSNVLKEEVDKEYEELKIVLSELDANYRITIENTDDKVIVVDNSALKFLEKFELQVLCIDSDATDKTISDVENLISDKTISYIYTFDDKELGDNTKNIIDKFPEVKIEKLHKLDNISDNERSENENYLSIMEENLNLIKQELYQ